jgi:hypothetical protein
MECPVSFEVFDGLRRGGGRCDRAGLEVDADHEGRAGW